MRLFRSKLCLLLALCMLLCCIPVSECFAATIDGVTYTMNYGRLKKVSGGTPGAELVVPATISGVTYNTIESAAFEGTQFGSIILPDSVKYIGYGCFRNCTQLTSVTLPENLLELNGCAFWGCTSLESIIIPDSVTSFEEHAFFECTSLKSVTLPASMTRLPQSTFSGCSSLVDVTLPASLTEFGENCFYGCSSLESIVIPEGVTSLPASLFASCTRLKSVSLPSTLTSIDNGVFQNCNSLCDITLPEGLTAIDNWAFYDCTSLSEIEFPQSLTSIGSNAFLRCQSLQTVTIPEGVTTIGPGTFADCTNLTEVYLHDGVKSFPTSAVDGSLKVTVNLSSSCPSLQSLINYTVPCRIIETGKTYNFIDYVNPNTSGNPNGEKVKAIVRGLIRDGMSDYEKVLILNNWFMRNVNYELGTFSPYDALFNGIGNCTAITSAFGAMLNVIGIENTEEYGSNHIWNMVKLGGEWYHLDATWNMSSRSWDYFCVSNYALEPVEDHQCYNKPHVSTAYKYNYAYYNGRLDRRIDECLSTIEENLAAGVTEFSFVPDSFTSNGIHNRTAVLVLRSKTFTCNGEAIKPQILYDNESRTITVSLPQPPMGTPDVVLPGSIIKIESESFRGTDVSIVYLHDGIEWIWDYAFADCGSLTQIRIPASVHYIAETAFQNVKGLRIYGYANSHAEAFAHEHGIEFALLD